MANTLTVLRMVLAPAILVTAATGHGRATALALVAAGLTDVLDGHLARRLGTDSPSSAKLDAVADGLVLLAGAMALVVLHPFIPRDNPGWLIATAAFYAPSLFVGTKPPERLSKLAGALLYAFALITLATGAYEPLLLRAALLALAAASVVRMVRATKTIQTTAVPRSTRCQAPQAANDVARRAGPEARIASSRIPSARETPR